MRLGISEVFEKADKAETIEEKKKIFEDNNSKTLIDVIRCVFDPDLRFLLPEGSIEYDKNPLVDCESIFYREGRKLYLFLDGMPNSRTLAPARRLRLFKTFLGNLAEADAELMLHVKDKRLPYPTLTREVMTEIFPDILQPAKD